MDGIASLAAYRRRRFPPRDFQIDPVMTVHVALDGLLKALDRLAQTSDDTEAARRAIPAERARLLQGIDFIFEGIDPSSGTLASGLLLVLLGDLRQRLVAGLAQGRTEFPLETRSLRQLQEVFSGLAGVGRAHG